MLGLMELLPTAARIVSAAASLGYGAAHLAADLAALPPCPERGEGMGFVVSLGVGGGVR